MIEIELEEGLICSADYFLPKYERKIPKPKKSYVKPESIKKLEEDWKVWHYSNTNIEKGLQYYIRYSDKDTNSLTKAIIAWFESNGHFASRRNTQGTWNARLGKFIKSGSTKGAEDIDGTIKGRNIKIEVKFGRDKVSPDQTKYRKNIEKAGGIYMIVKTFDNFLEQINRID